MDSSTGSAIKDEEPLRKFRLFIFMLISENKAGLKQSLGRNVNFLLNIYFPKASRITQ